MSDGTGKPSTPPPPVSATVRRLGASSGVRRELAALYADLRSGIVSTKHATAAAYVLTCVAKIIADERRLLLEERVAALESRAGVVETKVESRIGERDAYRH